MLDTVEFISVVLQHESIYDPVKAHEYYEKHKQLKGRRSGSALRNKRKREGWSYVQAQVKELKKKEFTTASINNKEATKQLREHASEYRKNLSTKIKDVIAGISSDVKSQIEALPEGLSKEERAAKVAEIRTKGATDKETNQMVRKQERDQIVADLKGALDDAKTNYKKARDGIVAKYEGILDREYEALRTSSS